MPSPAPKQPAKRKPGRPSSYTQEIADEICERIAGGETLSSVCRDERMPMRRTIYDWIVSNETFSAHIARARELGADAIADDTLRIADTPVDAYIEKAGKDGVEITKKDAIEHRRLQVDTRLKLLAKWCPKKYGEKVGVEIGANDELSGFLGLIRRGNNGQAAE